MESIGLRVTMEEKECYHRYLSILRE
jgi:hypothetical protein